MKRSFDHVYFLPTNRPISHSLDSYVAEIRHALEALKLHDRLLLCVVEDGDERNEALNRTYMAGLARELPEGMVKYVDRSLRQKLVEAIFAGQDEFRSLFLGRGLNYGRVANLTSLVAAYYSACCVHRRDSDTGLHARNGRPLFPMDLEVEYLANREKGGCLVGGSYIGEWNLDLSVFRGDRDLIKEFFSCMEIPASAHDAIVETQLRRNQADESFASEIRQVDGPHPDMGNIAYTREVFRSLPFPPHDETTGTDYFPMIALLKAGREVYLHNHHVVHAYIEERSSEKAVAKYFAAVARFIDYLQLYGKILDEAALWWQADPLSGLCASLKQALDQAKALEKEREASLQRFVGVMRRIHVPFGRMLADQIEGDIPDILDSGLSGLRNHLLLARNWEAIMKRAEKSDSLEIEVNAVH